MSQITERTNIISIEEIPPIREVHASMVNIRELSSYQPLSVALPDMKSFCPANVLSAINSASGDLNFRSSTTSICSPNALRTVFGNSFAPTIKRLQSQGVSSLDAKKAAMLSTLSTMDFKITDQHTITTGLKAVMGANDDKTLNTEIKSVMNQLEAAHTKVFAANIAKACAAASVKVGFTQITIKPVDGKLEVIAKNREGKHLVSEVAVNQKTNQVDSSTEPIGISDGSCARIIQQFNEELKKMGIKIGKEETTFTGGTCQLAYSKMIDQSEKVQQRKNKEQDRMKKLNTIPKAKI